MPYAQSDAVVYTLGCKINDIESRSIITALQESGYTVYEDFRPAALYVINTCAVTAEAERKSRQMASRARKFSPTAPILIIGCSAIKSPKDFGRDNISVITSQNKAEAVIDYITGAKYACSGGTSDYPYEKHLPARTKTRQFIKVQDGCDYFCSYCIVPYLRGRSRSRSVESVIAEVKTSEAQEVVLSGINLSDYGRHINASLPELIKSVGADIAARIRLGSLEARVITEELLSAAKSVNFCPHFHLSLQSGSDTVLRAMNRKYTTADFYNKVLLIRKYFPDAGITADIIAGHPGETEECFQEALQFVKKCAFSDEHIFPYSVREGTTAAKMPQIPVPVRKTRAAILTAAAKESSLAFINLLTGKTFTMLAEREQDGYITGYTENYVKIYLTDRVPLNKLYKVRIGAPYKDGALGELN